MPGQIGDQEPASRQELRELVEVPRRSPEAVHEQEGRSGPGAEDPNPRPTPLVVPFLEAREKNRRIRHVDRLFFSYCEFAGNKAGHPLSPRLCPKELKA